jgi:exo-beta-1,3-glucanase (GH17 family)
MRRILNNFPHRLVDSIIVGNEALFRNDLSPTELTGYIDYVREYLKRKDLNITVGTSEIGSNWTPELANHVDMLAVNVHPFFGGVLVNESTAWTYDFLLDKIAGIATSNNSLVISEVGWPTGGGRIQGSVAGISELQLFIDNWICSNQQSDIGWYWFEAFDSPWKVNAEQQENTWEAQWGLLTADRKLKNIKIPTCS